jgi:uncharacterized protein YkwD
MIKAIYISAIAVLAAFLILTAVIVDIPGFSDFTESTDNNGDVVEELTPVGEEAVEDIVSGTEEEEIIVEAVLSPGPLRASKEESFTSLTKLGVFTWTNTQRLLNGLPALDTDPVLDGIAKAKIDDMFDKQYFAHESPTGESAGDLAKKFGYKFLLIGENLALGDFGSDEILVQAWMDSPGHRANILNKSYREIGIAVGKGEFDGRETWLAVQSFGLPLSVCQQADKSLKNAIDERIDELDALEEEISDLRDELNSTFPKRGEFYANKVNEYNSVVNKYNAILDELSVWINTYNNQVYSFNTCVDSVL